MRKSQRVRGRGLGSKVRSARRAGHVTLADAGPFFTLGRGRGHISRLRVGVFRNRLRSSRQACHEDCRPLLRFRKVPSTGGNPIRPRIRLTETRKTSCIATHMSFPPRAVVRALAGAARNPASPGSTKSAAHLCSGCSHVKTPGLAFCPYFLALQVWLLVAQT